MGKGIDITAAVTTKLLNMPRKVLAHILLERIRSYLLRHRRPVLSGFTPYKSTIVRILALRVTVERHG